MVTFMVNTSEGDVMLLGVACIQVYKSAVPPLASAKHSSTPSSMNVILGELRKAGIEHETLEDVFRLAESIGEACDFFRQPGESRLRVLDLAVSLFDHVAAECIGDVVSLGFVESQDGAPGGTTGHSRGATASKD
ncbi:M91 protein [Murid betaherpesvirus 1]|uniref:M91 protein n=1 Tax=Murid herpesvirus 1 TaxID=10366 RepID=H2A2C2_MUHV1|nr:M91 protein [Murid betaherpesvirus 1]